MRTISAADANRHFSKLLREVQAGETVTITSRGVPVATMTPTQPDDASTSSRERDWRTFIADLRARPCLGLGSVRRDELYDDEP